MAKTHVNALLTMICPDCSHNGSCPLALPAIHGTLLMGGREGKRAEAAKRMKAGAA